MNEAGEIQDAFRPYFERTEIEQRVEPNQLYALKNKLDGFQIYWQQEVDAFAKVFFKPPERQREADKGLLNAAVDPAMGRFRAEPRERQVDFRHQLGTFLRLYSFLSQLVAFADVDLEKLYAFGRLLIGQLRIDEERGPQPIDNDVKLSYYRLTKTHEGSASLQVGESGFVYGPTKAGTGRAKQEDVVQLSELVQVLNEKFGTNFSAEDQLFFDQIIGDLKHDGQLGDQARNNSMDQFRLAFDPKGMTAMLSRMDRNENIANQFMSNEQLRAVALEIMMQQVYEYFKRSGPGTV